MAYFAPYVDETGLHYSSFEDIKQYYSDGAKEIFGNDIYLDADSQDGQLISILAKAAYDTCKSVEYAYNNTTPQTAKGVPLARLVLLNGIEKKAAGYSTAFCKLTGDPFTLIKNGVAQDISGNKWNLPKNVNLGENGAANVTVTAQEKGNITALAGSINQIYTPVAGWKTITNPNAANPATPEETDYELRARQRKTVALPSQGLVEGTESAINNITGVVDCIVKENDKSIEVTEQGVKLPPHSITCIVKGGSEKDIAQTIFYHKNQGCYTNGDVEITVFDMYNNVNTMRFFRPKDVPIKISFDLTPIQGYSSEIADNIKQSLIDYIYSLKISNDISYSVLYSIINGVMPDLKNPIFSISNLKIGKTSGETGTNDIVLNLDEEASLTSENVTINVQGED